MKRITKNNKCQFEGCSKYATKLIFNRKTNKIEAYCKKHGFEIIEGEQPEYICVCDNCGCILGIG